MTYTASADRYRAMSYRRTGRSGLKLPAVSLGLWHNFGEAHPRDRQRAVLRRAFDLGITHFDLANNYGPPYGAAEETFGEIFAGDFRPYRDELVISTKAGFDMWPGPYGDFGSRKYLIASLDRSLQRMGLDHVDIFYHHRPDPETPLEETMGALDSLVRAGKTRYVGISNYHRDQTERAGAILRDLGTPLLVHQAAYSILNRWIEPAGLLDTLADLGAGCVAFSPLAQGVLTDRYLNGIPADSRVRTSIFLSDRDLDAEKMNRVRALNDIARQRGQSLAQMALAWALRDPRMTSVIIGASSVEQLEANAGMLQNPELDSADLDAIDKIVQDDRAG